MTGDITEQTRCCKKCGQVKDLTLFLKKKLCPYGRGHTCNECGLAYMKDWQKANPESRRAIAKRTYEKRKLVVLIYHQLYKLANAKETRDSHKQWMHMNAEHLLKRNSEFRRDAICTLDDWYIARLINRSGRYSIGRSDIPPGLIAAKRAHIQVTRQLSTKAVLP